MKTVHVVLADTKAKIPSRETEGSIGFDLYSAENHLIRPKCRARVSTGIRMAIPNGYYGRIASRSGLAINRGIAVGGGVIDSDYRGIIFVILFNHSNRDDYRLFVGERIAQIIFERADPLSLEIVNILPDTARNENGFGSTDC
jgi:dUTP pyrophosphatase